METGQQRAWDGIWSPAMLPGEEGPWPGTPPERGLSGRRGRVTPAGGSSRPGLCHPSRARCSIPLPSMRTHSLGDFLPAQLGLSRGGRMELRQETLQEAKSLFFFPLVPIRSCGRECHFSHLDQQSCGWVFLGSCLAGSTESSVWHILFLHCGFEPGGGSGSKCELEISGSGSPEEAEGCLSGDVKHQDVKHQDVKHSKGMRCPWVTSSEAGIAPCVCCFLT